MILVVLLSVVATGCSTIYHRARAHSPQKPLEALEQQLAKARSAESSARRAGVQLLDDLERGRPREVLDPDFDRLGAAAYELERRLLAVEDSAKACGKTDKVAAEVKRLREEALSLQDYVHTHRSKDRKTQIRELQNVLSKR